MGREARHTGVEVWFRLHLLLWDLRAGRQVAYLFPLVLASVGEKSLKPLLAVDLIFFLKEKSDTRC